jgi:hypothetical protein
VAQDKFYSFEEALSELRLKEEELKRLVSEGEIRAFREGDTMKLRQMDVEALRNELSGGEVIDLGEVREELVFEDDVDLDETGMATEEIGDVDTLIEDDVEDVGELELEPAVAAPVAARAPRRATTTTTTRSVAVVEEEESEGMGLRLALIGTSLVLILAMPVCLAVSTGTASGLARGIANLFGAGIPE